MLIWQPMMTSSRVLYSIQDGRPEPMLQLAHQHIKSDSDIVSFATGTCFTLAIFERIIEAKRPEKLTVDLIVRLPKCWT